MTERRLIECKPWKATFERGGPDGKDGYHTIIVIADTMQDAMLLLAKHMLPTDCKMTELAQMTSVRAVIA
jgi:hypothetical protein